MKIWPQIIVSIIFPIYLVTVIKTEISLTGFWTDVVVSIVLSIVTLLIVFVGKIHKLWLSIILKVSNFLCSLFVFGILVIALINPFTWDTFKMRSFYFQRVEGRIFHAYFKPVGAYAGGYGNFWITESPKYFPLIEKRVYLDRTVNWDFGNDSFDGSPVDNYDVVRSYIKEKVIDKQKKDKSKQTFFYPH